MRQRHRPRGIFVLARQAGSASAIKAAAAVANRRIDFLPRFFSIRAFAAGSWEELGLGSAWLECACSNSDNAGRGIGMLQLQSCLGALVIPAIAFAFSENHRAVSWRRVLPAMALTVVLTILLLKIPALRRRFAAANRRGRCDRGGDPRRHLLRVRLCRRRRPALRSEISRLRIHPRLSGAAAGAGDERADHAAVLLAHPAADRARLFVGAGAHARHRRRGRTVDRRQYLRRHGGGAAVHPALSRQADARGIVHRHDRRHGRYRRHRAGALRHDPAPDHSGCRRRIC